MFMTTDWKTKCLRDIAPTVSLPGNFCYKNETSIRIHYYVGFQVKYILLSSPEEVAAFLKRHGVIHSFAFVQNEVKMYTLNLTASLGASGELTWKERLVPLMWEDIEITHERAFCMAVNNEFELANNTISNKIGKVIKHIFEAA